MKQARFLFVLKFREAPYTGEPYSNSLSSGLLNSARFIVDMLKASGVQADLVQVADNNAIDAQIVKYKPTVVVVEAFWVVPEKFDVLKKLHPKITFIVRNHSETPFLAGEGNAIAWTLGYLRRGVVVAPNSRAMLEDTLTVAFASGIARAQEHVVYLPNFYPLVGDYPGYEPHHHSRHHTVNVGCFGAIRPLKNHLQQAIAALDFAQRRGLKLRFHINATRVEGTNNILQNIRALFPAGSQHELVEHAWMPHEDFLKLLSEMDINLQVSFSETFNIVAADSVAKGVPVVGSREIEWLDPRSQAEPTDGLSIVEAMETAWNDATSKFQALQRRNWIRLFQLVNGARDRWLDLALEG